MRQKKQIEPIDKLLFDLEKKLSGDSVPPTYINLFNTGTIVDIKKLSLGIIKIVRQGRMITRKKGK